MEREGLRRTGTVAARSKIRTHSFFLVVSESMGCGVTVTKNWFSVCLFCGITGTIVVSNLMTSPRNEMSRQSTRQYSTAHVITGNDLNLDGLGVDARSDSNLLQEDDAAAAEAELEQALRTEDKVMAEDARKRSIHERIVDRNLLVCYVTFILFVTKPPG